MVNPTEFIDEAVESIRNQIGDENAIIALSGGVDSCFTVYRHARGLAGRRTRRLRAAVVQHGFDVWLDQKNSSEVFTRMLATAPGQFPAGRPRGGEEAHLVGREVTLLQQFPHYGADLPGRNSATDPSGVTVCTAAAREPSWSFCSDDTERQNH